MNFYWLIKIVQSQQKILPIKNCLLPSDNMSTKKRKAQELDSGIECEVKTLEFAFQSRKKRSKKFNDGVEDFITAIVALYSEIIVNSPTEQTKEFIDQDILENLLIQTYYSMPSLQDSGPFFSLLRWIKTLLVMFVECLEKLNYYEDAFQNNYNNSLTKFLQKSKEVCKKVEKVESDSDIQNEPIEPWKYEISVLQNKIKKLETNVKVLEEEVDEWKENWIGKVKEGNDDVSIVKILKNQAKKSKYKKLEHALEISLKELEDE
jgi:hypothetical protein